MSKTKWTKDQFTKYKEAMNERLQNMAEALIIVTDRTNILNQRLMDVEAKLPEKEKSSIIRPNSGIIIPK